MIGNDRNHPFMRPLWRRIAVVAVCLVWAGVEFWHGQTGWGLLSLGLAAYAVWAFLIAYDASEPGDG